MSGLLVSPAQDVKFLKGTAPVAVTSATTTASTGDRLNGYEWVVGVFNLGVIAASQAGTMSIQDSADDSTYANVTGATKTYVDTGSDGLVYVIAVRRNVCRAFVRTAITTTTTDSIVLSAVMMGFNGPLGPITNTSATVGAPVVVTTV